MQVIWSPGEAFVESANLTRLMRRLACDDYHALHRLSVDDPERFWPEAIDDLGLEFSRRWDRVLDDSAGPEWSKWFVGARLNIAANCVHRWRERYNTRFGTHARDPESPSRPHS